MKKNHIIIFSVLLVNILSLLSAQTKPDALELYRKGNFEESEAICKAEIDENPKNLESYVVLCWALVSAKKYAEADSWATKGRALSLYDPRLLEIQAEAKYYQGMNEQALKLFQDYISNTPNGSKTAVVYYFMGEIYLRQSRFRHADMAFSASLLQEPLNARWWVRLGYAREMAKEYKYALEAYNKALALDTALVDAMRGRDRVRDKL